MSRRLMYCYFFFVNSIVRSLPAAARISRSGVGIIRIVEDGTGNTRLHSSTISIPSIEISEYATTIRSDGNSDSNDSRVDF